MVSKNKLFLDIRCFYDSLIAFFGLTETRMNDYVANVSFRYNIAKEKNKNEIEYRTLS
jgi:hypothetical protein